MSEFLATVLMIGLGVFIGQWAFDRITTPPIQIQAVALVKSSGDPIRDFLDNYR